MKVLFIINDAPYGTEKAYNALRLAMQLQKDHDGVEVLVFLMADSVGCGLMQQTTPNGFYNIGRMLKSVINKGGEVKACGSCAQARGIQQQSMIAGVEISTMAQLAQWTAEADKVLTF